MSVSLLLVGVVGSRWLGRRIVCIEPLALFVSCSLCVGKEGSARPEYSFTHRTVPLLVHFWLRISSLATYGRLLARLAYHMKHKLCLNVADCLV